MPSIADTIRQRAAALASAAAGSVAGASSRLKRLEAFGSNPGALDGWFYAPDTKATTALVVVLHGCTQTAAGYDRCSGWSDLAERFGFALLFPEQRRENNANRCFNWFLAEDIRRGGGEALSIRQMIDAMTDRCAIDPQRRYVTGLSAGGAMAVVMLATYPDLFAGGAVIAGLPFGAATSTAQAFERMRGSGLGSDAVNADKVRRASPHQGRWPSLSIWHGDADRTVDVANAEALLGQWRALTGVGREPNSVDLLDGQRHRVWLGADGRMQIEDYRIAGLGHGTPLKTAGDASCGLAGPYMLEAGISSTWRQAERWGLLSGDRAARSPRPAAAARAPAAAPVPSVTATIERALRAAGLMR